jgi:hypothetical protein
MFDWLPKDVELMRDLSSADPIVATLEPWSADGVRLSSFMPEGFESYVRVFHPFFGRDRVLPRRWHDVAADQGRYSDLARWSRTSPTSAIRTGPPRDGWVPKRSASRS